MDTQLNLFNSKGYTFLAVGRGYLNPFKINAPLAEFLLVNLDLVLSFFFDLINISV